MSDAPDITAQIEVNGWTGAACQDAFPSQALRWGAGRHADWQASVKLLRPGAEADLRDWLDPRVGWGLVLPDNPALSDAERARADDAPEPIRKLLAFHKGVVLRHHADDLFGYLRRYFPDGRAVSRLSVEASPRGVGDYELPRYLMLYGGPDVLPWGLQFTLNVSAYVGRLHLTGEALDHYVSARLTDWSGGECKPLSPVLWSAEQGAQDITWLMSRVVAQPIWDGMAADAEFAAGLRLQAKKATAGALLQALADKAPGLVITTSHGVTGPADPALGDMLGVPVDSKGVPLDLDTLAGAWIPDGAIWYAHACCSAGSNSTSRFEKMFPEENKVGRMLRDVAATTRDAVAPLPTRLLGAEKPLRAFVGHVEPTFDWTLRDPNSFGVVTNAIRRALFDRLYEAGKRNPIGYALATVFEEASAFFVTWQAAVELVNQNQPDARRLALYRQLVAMDRQSLVILGDPTVSLPLTDA